MSRRILTNLALGLALLAAGFVPLPASAQGCLNDAAARAAFAGQQARPLATFLGAIAAATGGGRPVSAQLCDAGGRLVWSVVVLINGGQQRNVTVDALSGAVY